MKNRGMATSLRRILKGYFLRGFSRKFLMICAAAGAMRLCSKLLPTRKGTTRTSRTEHDSDLFAIEGVCMRRSKNFKRLPRAALAITLLLLVMAAVTLRTNLRLTDISHAQGPENPPSEFVNDSCPVDGCGGDPCCGDPCCGDPCCGDPCCGDPC